jgi:hypothetical protein
MKKFKKNFERMVKDIFGKEPEKIYYIGLTGLALIFTFLHLTKAEKETLHPKIKDYWYKKLLNYFWDKIGIHSGWYVEITLPRAKTAWNRILKAGYISKDGFLEVDEGCKITDKVFWGLLVNVANGFIKRSFKKGK